MRPLLAALVSLLLVSCSGCHPSPPPASTALPGSPTQLVAFARSATVALVENTNDAYRTHCAGVWIGETRMLTAAHCVDDVRPGELVQYAAWSDVEWPQNRPERITEAHKARLVRRDDGHDLALLTVAYAPHSHAWAHIAAGVEDGEPVILVGHPVGLLYTWLPGTVSATRFVLGPAGPSRVVHITTPAWYGNSGGAAINRRGEIAGLCSFLMTRTPSTTFFVHPLTIARFAAP